jgi:hypothetical protein
MSCVKVNHPMQRETQFAATFDRVASAAANPRFGKFCFTAHHAAIYINLESHPIKTLPMPSGPRSSTWMQILHLDAAVDLTVCKQFNGLTAIALRLGVW